MKRMLAHFEDPLSEADLQALKASHLFLSRALDGELVFPDFGKFIATLDKASSVFAVLLLSGGQSRGGVFFFFCQLTARARTPHQ